VREPFLPQMDTTIADVQMPAPFNDKLRLLRIESNMDTMYSHA